MARSYLYVPADDGAKLGKAAERGADALILDLEDGVAPSRKAAARQAAAGYLAGRDPGSRPALWVRVNPSTLEQDLRAVAATALAGVVLPKASVSSVYHADAALRTVEVATGMPIGAVALAALVETAAALLQLPALAAAPRVHHLGIGEADLAAELGLRPTPGEPELVPLRLQLVVASAAAGIAPPVGPVATDFTDLDALRTSSQALLRLGFAGRAAIHPRQLPVINAVFTPAAEEVERARELVRRFEAAQAAGHGAITGPDGRMIDLAVVRAAHALLDRAGG